jgi:hypothetical protein
MNKNIRFIMLEVSESVLNHEDFKKCPSVQIIFPSNKYSYLNIEEIRSRVGNSIRLDDKENNLFTITLNVDSDYVIPHPGE